MSDKTEQTVPRSKMSPIPSSIPGIGPLDKLRFQSYKDGKVHIHDDAQKLVFEAKTRPFQLAIEELVKTHYKFQAGDTALMKGSSSGDLVLIRHDTEWELVIAPTGTVKATALIGDEVLQYLDDWVQRL